MKCEVSRNGSPISAIMEYDQAAVQSLVSQHVGDPRLCPIKLQSKVTFGAFAITPVREIKPKINHLREYGAPSRHENNGVIYLSYPSVAILPSRVKAKLQTALADMHNQYIYGGRIQYRGYSVAAGAEAITAVDKARKRFEDGLTTFAQWRVKDQNGENALLNITGLAEIKALDAAIGAFQERCFAARTQLEQRIQALSDVELEAFNLDTAFKAIAYPQSPT